MPLRGRTKIRIGAGALALFGAYLLGFVPQYLRGRQLEAELRAERRRIEALESGAKLASARDLASVLFIETVNRNYGAAASRASEFFNHVRSIVTDSDAAHRDALEWILAQRDSVIASLARSDPAAQKQAQEILERALGINGPLRPP